AGRRLKQRIQEQRTAALAELLNGLSPQQEEALAAAIPALEALVPAARWPKNLRVAVPTELPEVFLRADGLAHGQLDAALRAVVVGVRAVAQRDDCRRHSRPASSAHTGCRTVCRPRRRPARQAAHHDRP